MEKKKIVALVLVIMAGVIASILISQEISQDKEFFESKKRTFEHMAESYLIESAMSQYFDNVAQYPDQYDQESLFNLSKDYSDLDTGEVNSLRRKFFIDPMSNRNQPLGYVRIVKNGKVCGYILLSSGIDGELNNTEFQFSSMEEALENLNLYLSNEFSSINYFFGKKDLILVKSYSCEE